MTFRTTNLLLFVLCWCSACSHGVEVAAPPGGAGGGAAEPTDQSAANIVLDSTLIKRALASFGDGGCGEGPRVVTLSDDYADQLIPLYNVADEQEWHAFSMVYDDSDGKYDYAKEGFLPYRLDPDNFDVAFLLKEEGADYFTVEVDRKGTLKRIKKAPYLQGLALVDFIGRAEWATVINTTEVIDRAGGRETLPAGTQLDVMGTRFGRLLVVPSDTVIQDAPFLLNVCKGGQPNVIDLK